MKPQVSRPSIPPIFVLLFGILSISTGSIFVRYAQGYAPSLVIATWRLVIAAAILAPFVLMRQRAELVKLSRRDASLMLASGFFLSLHFATWISSLEYTTVASSVVLVTTTPLWVGLLAPFTVKEPITRWIAIGLGLVVLGSLLVGVSDACTWQSQTLVCPPLNEFVQGDAFLGNVLALIGAVMAAAYVLIGRQLRVKLSLTLYIFLVYAAAAAFLLLFSLSAGHSLFGMPPQAYGWFVLLALFPQLFGHSSFNWALGYLPAAIVSISLVGEPIGSTILAYFLFSEAPTALKVIGAILILAGIGAASRSKNALDNQ